MRKKNLRKKNLIKRNLIKKNIRKKNKSWYLIKKVPDIKISSLEEIPEDKEIKIVKQDGTNNPLKEVISVNKVDNSDNETVDDFFNDVTRLLEEKGEKINKEAKKYTLFDDADEND